MDINNANNVNLTFYDLINHLIPGSLFVIFILYLYEDILVKIPSTLLIISVIILGYFIGNILSIVGNLLYFTYLHPKNYPNKTIKRWVVEKIHELTKIVVNQNYDTPQVDYLSPKIERLLKNKMKLKTDNKLGLFEICDAIISEQIYPERTLLLARQGFYRSISALILIVSIFELIRHPVGTNTVIILTLMTILLRLFIYAHTYFGIIRKNQIFILTYKNLLRNGKL